jgi:hypothetical protein
MRERVVRALDVRHRSRSRLEIELTICINLSVQRGTHIYARLLTPAAGATPRRGGTHGRVSVWCERGCSCRAVRLITLHASTGLRRNLANHAGAAEDSPN